MAASTSLLGGWRSCWATPAQGTVYPGRGDLPRYSQSCCMCNAARNEHITKYAVLMQLMLAIYES